MVPKATFTVEGEIADFTRVDNLYRTLKRESGRLLKDWKINFTINYIESEGELEIPE